MPIAPTMTQVRELVSPTGVASILNCWQRVGRGLKMKIGENRFAEFTYLSVAYR